MTDGNEGTQKHDKTVASETKYADPNLQAMEEASEWLDADQQPIDMDDSSGNAVLELLSSSGEEIGQLALEFIEIVEKGAEATSLEAVASVMELSSGLVRLSAGPFVERYGSARDRKEFDVALEMASNPSSLIMSIVMALHDRNKDVARGFERGVEAGHQIDMIHSMRGEIETLISTSSSTEATVSAIRLSSNLLHMISTTSTVSDSTPASPPYSGGLGQQTTPWSPILPTSKPADSLSRTLSLDPHVDEEIKQWNSFLKALSSAPSVRRELTGASVHPLWGDPQARQNTYSNGKSASGLNNYMDLSPTYLGGTAPEETYGVQPDDVDALANDNDDSGGSSTQVILP